MAAIQAANIPKSRSTFLLNFITDDTQFTLRQGQRRHTLSPTPLPKGEGIQGWFRRSLPRLRGRAGEGAPCSCPRANDRLPCQIAHCV